MILKTSLLLETKEYLKNLGYERMCIIAEKHLLSLSCCIRMQNMSNDRLTLQFFQYLEPTEKKKTNLRMAIIYR